MWTDIETSLAKFLWFRICIFGFERDLLTVGLHNSTINSVILPAQFICWPNLYFSPGPHTKKIAAPHPRKCKETIFNVKQIILHNANPYWDDHCEIIL